MGKTKGTVKMTTETMNLVVTIGVRHKLENDLEFANQVQNSLDRFQRNDWGDDMAPEDWKLNDSTNNQYALGSYKVGEEKVWIIREHDGSVTTVLFPEEY
tara:strand:- start:500 stop:799 length:300 start_codon:yes stop_codon:yes gene_type:complete